MLRHNHFLRRIYSRSDELWSPLRRVLVRIIKCTKDVTGTEALYKWWLRKPAETLILPYENNFSDYTPELLQRVQATCRTSELYSDEEQMELVRVYSDDDQVALVRVYVGQLLLAMRRSDLSVANTCTSFLVLAKRLSSIQKQRFGDCMHAFAICKKHRLRQEVEMASSFVTLRACWMTVRKKSRRRLWPL